MKDVALARDIVRAMRAAVDIPVKMRAGWDIIEECPGCSADVSRGGADGVTVHWRTRADKYGGE